MVLAVLVVAHGINLLCGNTSIPIDTLNNHLREVRVAVPEGATSCTLSRKGTAPTHLDLVAVEQDGARVALDLPEAVRARDLTLYDLAAPLSFKLPAPARGATLVLAGREELTHPGRPFLLRGRDYKVGENRGTLAIDGKLDQGLPAPFLRIATHPGSGHPDAWAKAWVRDDGKKLYAALDFASDDTDDNGDDWAEVWLGKDHYRVTVADHRFGATSMQRTPGAPYLHKVYEFAVPLPKGRDLDLAFAAYGTASQIDLTGGGISRDGRRLAWRAEHGVPPGGGSHTSELMFYGYADGGWSLQSDRLVDEGDGGAFPSTVSVVDSTATQMFFDGHAGYLQPGQNDTIAYAEVDRVQADGGLQITPLDAGTDYRNVLATATIGGDRVAVLGCGNGCGTGLLGTIRYLPPDGGTPVLESSALGFRSVNAYFSDDGTILTELPSGFVSEYRRSGSTWTGPLDGGSIPFVSGIGNHSTNGMSGTNDLIALCASGTASLYQRDGGFVPVPAFGSPACDAVTVNGSAQLAVESAGTVSIYAPAADGGYQATAIAQTDAGSATYLGLAEDGRSVLLEVADRTSTANGKREYYLGPLAGSAVSGAALPAQAYFASDAGNPLLSVAINGNPTDLITVSNLPVQLAGSYLPSVQAVSLYNDVDQSGSVTPGDVLLQTVSPDDAGVARFTGLDLAVNAQASTFVLASALVAPDAGYGNLRLSLDPSMAHAMTASTAYAFTLAGATIAGPPLAISAPDAGTPDAGTPDAGTPDAGQPDGGAPDAGSGGTGKKSSGCGCTGAGADGAAVAAGLLALLRRRRRMDRTKREASRIST